MSSKKNENDYMAMFPWLKAMPTAWDWSGKKNSGKKECKEKWDEFKSNLEKYWEQMQEMQTTSRKASKDQWAKFFDQLMEMEKTFADSLPDKAPSLPWLPAGALPSMSPRAFMEKVREFQEMANEHAVEQADSFFDFCKQGQEQAKDAVSEAVKNAEKQLEKAEKEAEEKKEAEVKAEEEEEAKAEAEAEAKAKAEAEAKAKAEKEAKAKAEKEAKAKAEKEAKAKAEKEAKAKAEKEAKAKAEKEAKAKAAEEPAKK